jgi:hypothetical protein
MKFIRSVLLAVALAGCAAMGGPPESQIKSGADKVTAGANLTLALLKRDKITVAQAKNYRALLGTASSALDDAAAALEACRKKTGSTSSTAPDPCKRTVTADINLVASILDEIESTLKAKE